MSNSMSLAYYSSEVADASMYELTMAFVPQTAAAGVAGIKQLPANNATLLAWTDGVVTYSNHPSQSEIDGFLNTTNEFTANKFDGTVITTTSDVGIIVNMLGQAKAVHGVTAMHLSDADIQDYQIGIDRALVDGGALAVSNIQVGAEGNIGIQLKFTGAAVNAAGGLVVVKVLWEPK